MPNGELSKKLRSALMYLKSRHGVVQERVGDADRGRFAALLESSVYKRLAEECRAPSRLIELRYVLDQAIVSVTAEDENGRYLLRNDFNLPPPDADEHWTPLQCDLGVRQGEPAGAANRALSNSTAAVLNCKPSTVRLHSRKLLDELVGYFSAGRDPIAAAPSSFGSSEHRSPEQHIGGRGDSDVIDLRSTPPTLPPEARLIIFTGISGTGVGEVMERTARGVDPPATVVRLDEEYLVLAAKEIDPTRAQVYSNFQTTLHGCSDLLLRRVWERALELSLPTVESALQEGKTVLLQLHATYMHAGSQSIFSPINFAKLTGTLQHFPVTHVICLIDDVFDSVMRLRRGNNVFSPSWGRVTWLSQYVREALDWRHQEIRTSQAIATALADLDRRFVLLPVKLPRSVLRRLIDNDPQRLYLSHPIAYLRAPNPEADRTDNMGELRRGIEDLASSVRDDQGCVLFEPTGIDEYRFELEAPNSDSPQASCPCRSIVLSPRWAKTYAEGDDPIWSDTSEREAALIETAFFQQAPEEGLIPEECSHLDSIVEEVKRQVAMRDRQLINQSDGVVALRPFIAGRIADGVKEEIDYFNRTRAMRSGDVSTLILVHPREDERRRRHAALELIISHYLRPSDLRPRSPAHGGDHDRFATLLHSVVDGLVELLEYPAIEARLAILGSDAGVHLAEITDLYLRADTDQTLAKVVRFLWPDAVPMWGPPNELQHSPNPAIRSAWAELVSLVVNNQTEPFFGLMQRYSDPAPGGAVSTTDYGLQDRVYNSLGVSILAALAGEEFSEDRQNRWCEMLNRFRDWVSISGSEAVAIEQTAEQLRGAIGLSVMSRAEPAD